MPCAPLLSTLYIDRGTASFACFRRRLTVARETRWVFAMSVRLSPRLRSRRTATRSISIGRRPICLPSNLVRRACPYPFDDEVALQLGDHSDDDDDGPAERAAGIDALPEANELDAEAVELVQHFEEVSNGPGYPVRGPHQDYLEPAAAGIAKQIIEPGPASLGPGDPVSVLANDLKIPLLGHRTKIMKLSLRVLVHSRYAQIKSYSFHIFPSIDVRTSRK